MPLALDIAFFEVYDSANIIPTSEGTSVYSVQPSSLSSLSWAKRGFLNTCIPGRKLFSSARGRERGSELEQSTTRILRGISQEPRRGGGNSEGKNRPSVWLWNCKQKWQSPIPPPTQPCNLTPTFALAWGLTQSHSCHRALRLLDSLWGHQKPKQVLPHLRSISARRTDGTMADLIQLQVPQQHGYKGTALSKQLAAAESHSPHQLSPLSDWRLDPLTWQHTPARTVNSFLPGLVGSRVGETSFSQQQQAARRVSALSGNCTLNLLLCGVFVILEPFEGLISIP